MKTGISVLIVVKQKKQPLFHGNKDLEYHHEERIIINFQGKL